MHIFDWSYFHAYLRNVLLMIKRGKKGKKSINNIKTLNDQCSHFSHLLHFYCFAVYSVLINLLHTFRGSELIQIASFIHFVS